MLINKSWRLSMPHQFNMLYLKYVQLSFKLLVLEINRVITCLDTYNTKQLQVAHIELYSTS